MLCALAAQFCTVQGWERLGHSRLGDYAAECLGISGRSLLDWAHTEQALQRLKGLEEALSSGALGWTKVRLLARVATPEDEDAWLALAHRVSALALAGEVRAIDLRARGQPGDVENELEGSSEGPRTLVSIRGSPQARVAWRRCHSLARRVSGEAAPVWQAMEWVAAEVLSALPRDPVLADELGSEPEAGVLSPGRREGGMSRRPDPELEPGPLAPALALLLDDLQDADAFELHRRLEVAVSRERQLEAEIAPLLLQVFEAKLFRRPGRGYTRFDDYASDRLGFSARRARMLLRVARAARSCPALAAAWRSGKLTWIKAHELVPVAALVETRHVRDWIEWASRVTVRRLREDVVRAVDLAALDPARIAATGGLPEDADERQTGAAPAAPRGEPFSFSAPVVVAQLFRAAASRVRRHLERSRGQPASEDEAVRFMFEHFREVWEQKRVPARHAVFARDGWRCTVPGCSSYRNLHDHHIVFRSQGGTDAHSNRTTLCAWHHLRGVHAGRLRISGSAPEGLRFDLALASYDAQERILDQAERSTTMAL